MQEQTGQTSKKKQKSALQSEPTAPLLIARRYEIISSLTGGMGIVYLCRDHNTNQAVALKTFKPEYLSHHVARDLFLKEGTMWVEIGAHPHIVRAFRVERIGDGREVYLVLEWVVQSKDKDSPSLRSWLWPGKPLTLEQSLRFALHIARGMKYAVRKIPGLVHRDLKPENVLIGFDGVAKVTDFGLARMSEQIRVSSLSNTLKKEDAEESKNVVGTPMYMAPEQWENQSLDARADIYALGCILYEMATGYPAAMGENQEELREIHLIGRIKPPPSNLPREVVAVLRRSLIPDRSRRFRSWQEMEKALVEAYTAVTGQEPTLEQLATHETKADRISAGMSYNTMGLSYLDIGKLSVAVMYFERVVSVARTEESLELEGAGLGNLGLAYTAMGYLDRAIEFFKEHISIAHELGDEAEECRALGNLGHAYRRIGKSQQAVRLHERELAIARKLGDRFREAAALDSLGGTYRESDNVSQAVDFYKQSLVIARDIGDHVRVRSILTSMGQVYLASNDIKEAATLFRQSLEIAKKMGDRIGEGVALGSLGDLHRQSQNTERAIDLYKLALTISEESNDRRKELRNLNRLGDIYFEMKDVGEARDRYEAALAAAQEIGDKTSEMRGFEKVGSAYYELGDYMHAASLYRRMYGLAQEMGDRDTEQRALLKLGQAYESWGDFRRTITYFEQHLAFSREKNDRDAEVKMLARLGLLYDKTKQLKPAIQTYETYLALARELEDADLIGDALNRLGKMSRARLDLEPAIDLYREALELAREREDLPAEARALGNLGLAYTEHGKKWQATRSCDKALAAARKSKSANSIAWANYRYALTLFKQEKWQKVFPYAEKSQQLFVQLNNEEMADKAQSLYDEAVKEERKKRASGFLF
ncbi:MAG: tetratricopeptide repeat protein [Chloroflexi bacterium]|nr:tetratricopeptide repeat protein [Chloroflexota bacterium]